MQFIAKCKNFLLKASKLTIQKNLHSQKVCKTEHSWSHTICYTAPELMLSFHKSFYFHFHIQQKTMSKHLNYKYNRFSDQPIAQLKWSLVFDSCCKALGWGEKTKCWKCAGIIVFGFSPRWGHGIVGERTNQSPSQS